MLLQVMKHTSIPLVASGGVSSLSDIEELKKQNYECYVLSNWSAETFIGMTDDYPFLQSFNGLLISGEDNMMKPDAEIYELAITRFNLIPQETVFIDDKLEGETLKYRENGQLLRRQHYKNGAAFNGKLR